MDQCSLIELLGQASVSEGVWMKWGVVVQRFSVARLGGFESAWNDPNGLLNLGWLPQPL